MASILRTKQVFWDRVSVSNSVISSSFLLVYSGGREAKQIIFQNGLNTGVHVAVCFDNSLTDQILVLAQNNQWAVRAFNLAEMGLDSRGPISVRNATGSVPASGELTILVGTTEINTDS